MEIQLHGIEDVLRNLKKVNVATLKKAYQASQLTAVQMEDHAMDTAPWHDRTGVARMSIYGYVDISSTDIIIYHGIQVYYGVYLELSNGGRYRVIAPTVNKFRTIWQSNLSGILSI